MIQVNTLLNAAHWLTLVGVWVSASKTLELFDNLLKRKASE